MVEPGRRCLGDRYELHQLIAAGGMGQVWRGQDIALHRPVAVKVLRSEYTGDPTFLARFRAEAQHAASLSHPNIAAVFDYGEEIAAGRHRRDAGLPGDGARRGRAALGAARPRGRRSDTATTLSLLRQTAFGLGEAHRAGHGPPRREAGQHPGPPRRQREDHRLRHRPLGPQRRAHQDRPGHRHAPVPLPGAGRGPAGHPGQRRLRAGPDRLRVPDRPPGLRRRQRGHHRAQAGPPGPRAAARRPAGRRPGADQPRAGQGPGRALRRRRRVRRRHRRHPGRAAAARRRRPPSPSRSPPSSARPGGRRRETQSTGSVSRPPAARRRSRVAMVLLPILGLLAGAGIAVALLQALTDARPGAPRPTRPSSARAAASCSTPTTTSATRSTR